MTAKPRVLTATAFADLRPALDGWADPVAFGVGHDGAVYAAARRHSKEELRKDGGFWKSNLDTPVDWKIVRWAGGDVRTMTVAGVSVLVSYVQPLLGSVLLAGSRCFWRPEGPEQNAVVVDWDGNVERRFTLGDGIKDLRVTADGDVWVSYFDEGVFGNYGWSSPGPPAIGASGLVRFDREGKTLFSYDADRAGTDSICDAYAMNYAGDGDLWVYFYTEFPIVRIRRDEYRTWTLGVAGAKALAVRDPQALLFGDYKQRNRGRVVALEGNSARVIEEVRVEDESGAPIDGAVAQGRGDRLFFFKDRQALVLHDW